MVKKADSELSSFSQMPFLVPTSRNHSLAFILSVSTNTTEQGKGCQSLCVSCEADPPESITCNEYDLH